MAICAVMAICIILFCFYLYEEKPKNLKVQKEEETLVKEDEQKINKEEEEALRTLNPLICQSIEDEEKKNGCIEQVEQNTENLREVNPVYLGSLFFQAGNYDDAIDVYKNAVADKNEYVDVRTYLALALTYSEKGIMKHQEEICFPEALKWADKAVDLEPNNPEVYRARGYVYEARSDFFAAVDNYNKSLEIDANYIPAYVGRCHVNSLLGLSKNALEDCQKAVEIDNEKRFPLAYLHLCRLELSMSGKQDEAIKNCQVVANSPSANKNDKSIAYQIIATIKINQGGLDNEILVLLQQAIFYAPQDPNNYLTLAIFYNKKEDFEKAKINAKKTIGMDKGKAVAFGELGYAQFKTNEIDEALENFSNAIKLINQDYSLLVGSKKNYKDKYCGYLKDIYQERSWDFEEVLCQE